jgi:hypothetical protein
LKTWLRSSPNPFSRLLQGMALVAIPCFALAQDTPLQTPASTSYPGSYESFEKLVGFDAERFKAKTQALEGRVVTAAELTGVTPVDLDPDFLNTLILNTPSSFMRLAARDKCAFYDVLVADLLRTPDGKVTQIYVQYKNKQGADVSARISKADFLEAVVYPACPGTRELVARFQVRTLDATLKATSFNVPANREQCEVLLQNWLQDPRTPYWCQVHSLAESGLIRESKDKQTTDDKTIITLARVLRGKLGQERQEYLGHVCRHADNPRLFCDAFFAGSFFSKVADKSRSELYIKDVCQELLKTSNWSPAILAVCVSRLKREPDACMWGGKNLSGLSPRPRCDHLSLALNNSALAADYEDCPGHSDNFAVTNFARLISHTDRPLPQPTAGFCSARSAGVFLEFNRRFDNEQVWTAGTCYLDRVEDKEVCNPAFFGQYGEDPAGMSRALENVLYRTKGLGRDIKCSVVSSEVFNPNLLEYRHGCHIVVNPQNCGLAQCDHRVFIHEREIKDIKFKGQLAFDYFPFAAQTEKYSLTYILQRDAQKKTRSIQSLPALESFFKQQPRGIIHGIGCAEDLLPGFFRAQAFNQCQPLPFIVDGIVKEGDRAAIITRSAADDVHAPRLLPWGQVYSAVKSYQGHHPLKLWTMHALQ